MDKTKSVVKDFMGKAGHKDTTIHETINPAVQHEVVKPTRHEDVKTAVEKEIHQDHYHHTVQPVKDKEVLPEQHTSEVSPVQHREYDQRNPDEIKKALASENKKFRNERKVQETVQTQSHAPPAVGEEVHHHIHETIQPVVEKETVQPTVVHTTVPIHETHHNTAQHHSTSVLPTVSMDEFKKQGGSLGGREERFDAFEGEPKNIGSGHTVHRKKDSGYDEHHLPKGVFHGDVDPLDGKTRRGQGDETRHSTDSDTKSKQHSGLLDKLNPKTDADHDGKAGFMS
ncbi:hypothetical protein DL769_007612 [Monosporascus sp. CRB-8-3]|nr:hypothetical protein DL769_007612 [Monosporascus sp. CRB-8-3]